MYRGEARSLLSVAKDHGLAESTVRSRMNAGATLEEALAKPKAPESRGRWVADFEKRSGVPIEEFLADCARDGDRIKDAAESIGVNRDTLSSWILRMGMKWSELGKKCLRNATHEEMMEVVRMRQEGMTMAEIAFATGRSESTASNLVRKAKRLALMDQDW